MEKKKINITVKKQNWEKLQALVKELGWPKNWLSGQIDMVVEGLLVVAEHAKKDIEERKEMTEAEALKRYEDLMRRFLEEGKER